MILKPEDIELRPTADGSFTFYRKDLDETYHSMHGALQEARHVFIQHGLRELLPSQSEIRILEIGLGTGLNALLTCLELTDFQPDNNSVSIHYDGLEAFPLPNEILAQIDYSIIIEDKRIAEWYETLHAAPFDETLQWTNAMRMHKMHNTLQDCVFEKSVYDLVYFDAFGPRAQEEMWHRDLLEKIHAAMKPNAILVTYCAKGSFKRDLKSLGFEVESLPGPPGKREMTRGWKR
jgi:tRNA U34 5-methylaminomethyl-2-thiouridine-forming methyltransferase MnmC